MDQGRMDAKQRQQHRQQIDTKQQQQRILCCSSCNTSNADFSKKERKRGAEAQCNACNPLLGANREAQQARQKAERALTREARQARQKAEKETKKAERALTIEAQQARQKAEKERKKAERALPMCCASCNKSNIDFSKKERKRGAEAQCNACNPLIIANREAQQARRKAEKERIKAEQAIRQAEEQEHYRLEYLAEKAIKVANGPQIEMPTFEVPGFGTLWGPDEDYEYADYKCPEMAFHQSPTTLESLVGSYDLVFYNTQGGGEDHHNNRLTKGSLDFTIDEATGELTGSIAIDKSVKNDMFQHRHDSKITCQNGERGYLSFQVTNMDELENICEDEVSGTIQRVAKRRAVRYMPEGQYTIDYQREYGQSIQFENETEAQSILDRFTCGNEQLLWLSNHMQVPEQVSALVRGFASSKPLPIFFFEEDDLWLTFEWHVCHRGDDFGTTLVARRRR
jgi:hypothetical protein